MYESTREAVNQVAKVWRMCKKQEVLFKNAMCVDGPIALRKVCCLGYMASLIFRKELGFLYDDLKCTLTDADLNYVNVSDDSPNYDKADTVALWEASEHLSIINEQCRHLMQRLDLYDHRRMLFKEYVSTIEGLVHDLDLKLITSRRSKQKYYEVA